MSESQNLLDPRFSKTIVLIEPGFQKYRPRFNKQFIEHITQRPGLILLTYSKPRGLLNLFV